MKPDACKGCKLYATGSGFVPGEGPENAEVAICGEAPGEQEAAQSRPFVGPSGKLLNALLAEAGLSRSSVYVTNAIKCRPPGNRKPEPEEIDACALRYLSAELRNPSIKTWIAVGAIALQATTGRTKVKIVAERGSTYAPSVVPVSPPADHGGAIWHLNRVIPTLHPAFLMRGQMPECRTVISDLRRAATPQVAPPRQHLKTKASLADLAEVLRDARASHGLVLDLETTGISPYTPETEVRCVGLAARGSTTAYSFMWSREVRETLSRFFERRETPIIGHNIGQFDLPILKHAGVYATEDVDFIDTMQLAHLCSPDTANDLEYTASIYAPFYERWKHEAPKRVWESQDYEGLMRYNAKDVWFNNALLEPLEREAARLRVSALYESAVKPLTRTLVRMSQHGIRVDRDRMTLLRSVVERKCDELRVSLDAQVRESINWASTKQLGTLLYDKMGLPEVRDRKTGNRTVDEDALTRLYKKTNNSFLQQIIRLREAEKASSTYLDLPVGLDGRVHPSFLVHGTGTGRLSSRDPNAQNIPEGTIRKLFLPEHGHVWLSADFSQIEARCVALLSNEHALLDAFKQGLDIFQYAYADCFGVLYNDVTRPQRNSMKTVIHGTNYGRGARAIAHELGLPTVTVQSFIDRYFSKYPAIKSYREARLAYARKHDYLRTPFGRIRWFYGYDIATQVFSFDAQSVAADCMIRVLPQIETALLNGSNILATVHDSVEISVPINKKEETEKIVREIMTQSIPELSNYRFPCSISSGPTWGDLK